MTGRKYTTGEFNKGCVIYSTLENFVSNPPKDREKMSKKDLNDLKHYIDVVEKEFNDESLSVKGISITAKNLYKEQLEKK